MFYLPLSPQPELSLLILSFPTPLLSISSPDMGYGSTLFPRRKATVLRSPGSSRAHSQTRVRPISFSLFHGWPPERATLSPPPTPVLQNPYSHAIPNKASGAFSGDRQSPEPWLSSDLEVQTKVMRGRSAKPHPRHPIHHSNSQRGAISGFKFSRTEIWSSCYRKGF